MRSTAGGRIVYGPFPVRPGRLVGAFATLVVAVAFAGIALETQHLACDFGGGGACVLTSVASLRADARFASRDLRRVRMESDWRGKRNKTEYGIVVLTVADRELRLKGIDPDAARAIVRTVQAGITRGEAFRVTAAGERWLLLLSAAFGLVALSMAWTGVRRMGSFTLTLRPDRTLSVTRRVLGVPIWSHELSLAGVVDVAIAWTEERDFWRHRWMVPRRLGRIAFVGRDNQQPMTSWYWPGQTLHFRAAAALRRALGLAPGPLEDELAALEASRERPLWARHARARVGLAWAGMCTGAIAGLAVLLAAGVATGRMRFSAGIEPWMVAVGCGGGAIAGAALVFYLARLRPPR
jgi:hypothetical protein